MPLTSEQVNAFQKLYQERFGYALTEAEARDQGTRLITLLKVFMKEYEQK